MLTPIIEKLMQQQNLTIDEMRNAINLILDSDNDAQVSAFLSLLHSKGETVDELFAMVTVLREKMVTINFNEPVLDIVGTGGDGYNTVNISTGSAILAAACGVKVAKHGNRSVSSRCGSADVLEHLGINIYQNQDEIMQNIALYNFGFLYAPQFNPAFAKLKMIRNKLGVRSSFNLIGPLLNPANAQYLMIGVADPTLLMTFAKVVDKLGCQQALIFHCSGLDEICCVAPIDIVEVQQGQIKQYRLDPETLGFSACTIESLQGGDTTINAQKLLSALQGQVGPIADTLILNAGIANYLYGICTTIKDGVVLARQHLHSGFAYRLLGKLKQPDLLSNILATKKTEVAQLKQQLFNKTKCKRFSRALKEDGLGFICEIKRATPRKGILRQNIDAVEQTKKYLSAGANAISVLTDHTYFNGSLSDLKRVKQELDQYDIPVLRKDFIIDESQIIESALAGVDAILLIVRVSGNKTADFIKLTKALNMEAIVEVNNRSELDLAIKSGAEIIAINNRDLKTFQVSISTSLSLSKYIPDHIIKISASGINNQDDITQLNKAGYDAILIGEALMTSAQPTNLIKNLRSST